MGYYTGGGYLREHQRLSTQYPSAKERKSFREYREKNMPAFTYSSEDVARTEVVKEKVWVPCLIVKHEEKVSKKEERKGIINHTFTFKVEDGDYKGLVLTGVFPEDYPSMAFPFLTAMGVELQKGGGTVNMHDFEKQRVQVCVEPGEYQGKPSNQIVSYRPIDWSPVTE